MLKRFISRDDESNLERWQVVFISDGFVCERFILAASDPLPSGDMPEGDPPIPYDESRSAVSGDNY